MSGKHWIVVGGVLGALGVALGAFGAHWLDGAVQTWHLTVEEQWKSKNIWEVAVRYQMYNALALVGVGYLAMYCPRRCWHIAGGCFTGGSLIFSGCLYAIVLTGIKVLGAVVPIGGGLMIAGWVALAYGAARMAAK